MEITFELVRWEPDELAELTDALNAAGIAHRLEGIQLTVEEYDADRTDALIEEVSNPGDGDGGAEVAGGGGGGEDEDEVGYQLEGWRDDQLDQLERALVARQLSYSWDEDGTLVVAASDEHTVDALIAEVEGTMQEALAELAGPVRAVVADPAVLETPEFIDPATLVLAGHPSPEVRQLLQDLLFRSDAAGPAAVKRWARELADLLPKPSTVARMPDDPDGHDELVYELVDWSPGMREELVLVLEREGIPYEWDGNDLAVPAAYESEVDALMDQMEQGDELPATSASGDDDEANYQRLSELFDAADRVARNPSDVTQCAELVGAADLVAGLPALYGIDDLTWRAILEQAALAVAAIDGEEDDRAVAERAAKLRDALRGFV